jgi:hypothetical protein
MRPIFAISFDTKRTLPHRPIFWEIKWRRLQYLMEDESDKSRRFRLAGLAARAWSNIKRCPGGFVEVEIREIEFPPHPWFSADFTTAREKQDEAFRRFGITRH